MTRRGIDNGSCPPTRVARSIWTDKEMAFAEVLSQSLQRKVKIFLKIRVLDVIEFGTAIDRRQLFFWRDLLGSQHFDYVVCRRDTLEPLLAVELDDPAEQRRSTAGDDATATAARRASFPLVRFSTTMKLTPELVRPRLIAEYRLVRAGALPDAME